MFIEFETVYNGKFFVEDNQIHALLERQPDSTTVFFSGGQIEIKGAVEEVRKKILEAQAERFTSRPVFYREIK